MEQLELDNLGTKTTTEVGLSTNKDVYYITIVQEFSNEPEDYEHSVLSFKTREELVAFINELQDKVRKL